MSELHSAEYYRRREYQERDMAAAAVSPASAAIHAEMAYRYSDLVIRAGPTPRLRLAHSA